MGHSLSTVAAPIQTVLGDPVALIAFAKEGTTVHHSHAIAEALPAALEAARLTSAPGCTQQIWILSNFVCGIFTLL